MSKQNKSQTTDQAAAQASWLIMVRHTAVDENLRGVCYGASDVGLSAAGRDHIDVLAGELSALSPSHIIHSGLARTRRLAEAISIQLGSKPLYEPRIAEFNFGKWELRRWDEIHSDGHDIARLIHEPEAFSPPGGETVSAMQNRVMEWYSELPSQARILAVSHGGPISTLRGSLNGAVPASWPGLVPAYGEQIRFDLPNSKA